MDEDCTPPTEPSGALVPPGMVPPTAVGASTPPPPVPERSGRRPYMRSQTPVSRAIARTLDAVDELADAVAQGLGLRRE